MPLLIMEWNQLRIKSSLSSTRRYGSVSPPGRYSLSQPQIMFGDVLVKLTNVPGKEEQVYEATL